MKEVKYRIDETENKIDLKSMIQILKKYESTYVLKAHESKLNRSVEARGATRYSQPSSIAQME
jgi:hypothetical protein